MKRNFHFTTHVKSAGLLHKILLSTRIVFLLLLVSAFQAVANKSYIEVTKLTLSMENTSIKEVLSNIEENSEFYFLYSSKVVDVQQKVSVNIKNKGIFKVLDEMGGIGLRGVFHSFTGTAADLEKALSYDFMIGINGIVTFKNSNLGSVVQSIPKDRLLLETDAPFLAPVPYRGKRNESRYIINIAVKVAEIFNLTLEEVARLTSRNADKMFQPNLQYGS